MPADDRHAAPRLSIGAVERETGLLKDTLRAWERRYGFPNPQRDALGERAYSIDEVARLRLIRSLLDAGHRPGKIIGLPESDLRTLAAATHPARQRSLDPEPRSDEIERLIGLLTSHRTDELRKRLSQTLLRIGLERFVVEICAPLTRMVGEAWSRGELQVHEEHAYTEIVQFVLRTAIGTIPETTGGPRVLLTTLPGEEHGLGLLMVEAILALAGGRCTSLGTQTPVRDIVLAADAQHAQIVGLSFSACMNPNQVVEGLSTLRAQLPRHTELWAGGGAPVLGRRPPDDVVVLQGLEAIAPALDRWRAAQHANGPRGARHASR